MKEFIKYNEIERLKIRKILAKNGLKLTDNDLVLFENKKILKLIKDNKEYLFDNNVIIYT
jgi:hypothetical protein